MLKILQRWAARSLARAPDAWLRLGSEATPPQRRGRTLDARLALLARRAAEPPLHALTPAAARDRVRAAAAALAGPPRASIEREQRGIPGAAGVIPLRAYRPPHLDGPRPLLLYFHQGGFVVGDLDLCEAFCTLLAETARCVVASVGYRLAPEHRFPAAHDDAYAAFAWAREHAGEIGGDAQRILVGGDGAGATLAAAICQQAVRRGHSLPRLQLLVYPWLIACADGASYRDFGDAAPLTREDVRWCLAHYLGSDAERDDPRAWPLLAPDLSALPPALIVAAGFDPLCDEAAEYASRLRGAGVPVAHRCCEALCHGFSALGGAVPAARCALEQIAWDLERVLTRDALPHAARDPSA
ncbi:MAG: alpha/beta hydrolase [Myxococcales bacterium]|nr:alpha/beta hydrolase [Myxococcales bacterium]MDH5305768.1 alpha/beta hydrolase [Myxococcales bacterium]MDH5565316.1 alpha/beta hydrolase [Myxococcales bacterium]